MTKNDAKYEIEVEVTLRRVDKTTWDTTNYQRKATVESDVPFTPKLARKLTRELAGQMATSAVNRESTDQMIAIMNRAPGDEIE